MVKYAIQMLIGDKVKYIVLIFALAFSTLLMVQQSAVFVGVMKSTSAILYNTIAPIWVVNPRVENVNGLFPMRDIDLYAVKSVSGVKWALPFYAAAITGRLYHGQSNDILLVGVDASTLFGIPPLMEGNIEDLHKPNSIIIDKKALKRFHKNTGESLTSGDFLDINDHELEIVGISKGLENLFAPATIYTTYQRALEIAPPVRKHLGAILVQPNEGIDPKKLAHEIIQQTHLQAYTRDEFIDKNYEWHFKNTGIPDSFFIPIVLGFIVGLAVSGQTFYAFIIENLGNFAALKVMGIDSSTIRKMLVAQAIVAGLIGYGIGLLLTCLLAIFTISTEKLPFVLTFKILLIVLITILFICLVIASICIRKINRIEPAEVFRG